MEGNQNLHQLCSGQLDSVHSTHGGQVHGLTDYTVNTSSTLQPYLKYRVFHNERADVIALCIANVLHYN